MDQTLEHCHWHLSLPHLRWQLRLKGKKNTWLKLRGTLFILHRVKWPSWHFSIWKVWFLFLDKKQQPQLEVLKHLKNWWKKQMMILKGKHLENVKYFLEAYFSGKDFTFILFTFYGWQALVYTYVALYPWNVPFLWFLSHISPCLKIKFKTFIK